MDTYDLNYNTVALEEEHSKRICALQKELSIQLLEKDDIIQSLRGEFQFI